MVQRHQINPHMLRHLTSTLLDVVLNKYDVLDGLNNHTLITQDMLTVKSHNDCIWSHRHLSAPPN